MTLVVFSPRSYDPLRFIVIASMSSSCEAGSQSDLEVVTHLITFSSPWQATVVFIFVLSFVPYHWPLLPGPLWLFIVYHFFDRIISLWRGKSLLLRFLWNIFPWLVYVVPLVSVTKIMCTFPYSCTFKCICM